MICKNCNSKNIKARKNFSHGKSSGSKKSYSCKDCGSSNVEMPRVNNFRRRR